MEPLEKLKHVFQHLIIALLLCFTRLRNQYFPVAYLATSHLLAACSSKQDVALLTMGGVKWG